MLVYRDGRPLAPERLTRHLNSLVVVPQRACRRSGCTTSDTARRPSGWRAGRELKVVPAMLGHATIQRTADTYAAFCRTQSAPPP